MKELFYYLLQVIITSGILYGYYHLFLRNKRFHSYNRFYLIAATVLSIIIPFLNIPFYFTQTEKESSILLQTLSVLSETGTAERIVLTNKTDINTQWFTWNNFAILFYSLIALLATFRIFISLLKIYRIIKANKVEQIEKIHFVNTEEPGTPFSFFRWLFWNRNIELQSAKGEQIFRHEIYHIEQKHSWDTIYTEILTIFFWINPFFHLVKKEIKAIHEFLADQFAINENKKWEYAELLLMQVLNTKQSLVNPFFHNQIKRRIAMITTSKKPSYQYLRKIMVLPIAAIAVALFAFSYKSKTTVKKDTAFEKTFTVIIDAGHGGADAGVTAADGTTEKELVLAIAKKIKVLNQDANINIILTRENDYLQELNEKTQLVAKHNADLLLSLHIAGEGKNSTKNGFEVFVSKNNSKYYSENKILATILLNYFMQSSLVNSTIIRQRDAGIWVLDKANCPSVLVECGYISNEKDLNFLKKENNQKKIAQNILMAIDEYVHQQKGEDWNERKWTVSDTARPDIKFSYNDVTGKYYATWNGKRATKIMMYEQTEQLVFLFGEKETLMISEEQSDEIRKKFGKGFDNSIEKNSIVIAEPDNKEDEDKIFNKVEIEATFPGGKAKWKEFLQKNLNTKVPIENKAPDGTYTTIVQFIVNTDGTIYDIRPLTNHGYGLEQEAVRVIRNSVKWLPAIQNGRTVRAYRNQPITFVVKKKSTNQVALINNSFPNEGNVIYIGVENEILILNSKYTLDKMPASISKGGFVKHKNSRLIVTANTEGKLTIRLFAFENNKKIDVGSFEFVAKVLSKEQTANLSTKNSIPTQTPSISLSTLKKSTPHQLLHLKKEEKINSFRFGIDLVNGDIVEVQNFGNLFNYTVQFQINNATVGKLVTFDDIVVNGNKIPSIGYKITN